VVVFRDFGSGVLDAALRAVPGGVIGGVGGGDGEARGGTQGGAIGGFAGPALDAEEVEDGIAEGGAGPGGMGRLDSFEAYEA
jgi:hypothetical protein